MRRKDEEEVRRRGRGKSPKVPESLGTIHNQNLGSLTEVGRNNALAQLGMVEVDQRKFEVVSAPLSEEEDILRDYFLGDGLATIDEHNPFLFYGAKVIKWHGRMLTRFMGMDTTWDEMMSQVTNTPNQTPLLAQLDKVSIGTQIIGLSISIFIPLVVFLHFEVRKQKHHPRMPNIKEKPTSIKDLMEAIKRIIFRPSGKEVWIGEELINEDSMIDEHVIDALCKRISISFMMPQGPSNSIEDWLLSKATLKLGAEKETNKQSCTIVDAKNLSFTEEESKILMRENRDKENHMWLHYRGPAKVILSMCSCNFDCKGTMNNMNEQKKSDFERVVECMPSKQLKIMAIAYNASSFEDSSLPLIRLLGLKHICWTETRKAIEACRKTGIGVKLISKDKLADMEGIGLDFGLLSDSDKLVLEAEDF
ncbi:putative calcium-transporting ATPase 13, plasma membrane-type [Pistacia vera]|uniref:putative calcium-transporting ATPase 13, plasma membrane-type n=1 Tax=Pistacia vera TaxID=55513 RepID=UPI001263E34D|nr:putative calcium-transporting ATPase 13, plasma membrane-type [Pistacia vera]